MYDDNELSEFTNTGSKNVRIQHSHYSDSEECHSPCASIKRKCNFPSVIFQTSSDEETDSGEAHESRRKGFDHHTNSSSKTAAPEKLPTVFKWTGGGKNVMISGSFDNWKSKIPMVKSHSDFYTIVDLEEGVHEYMYFVDGQWKHDLKESKKDIHGGSVHNVVTVKSSDFEVFEALAIDSESTGHDLTGSPTGEYSSEIPSRTTDSSMNYYLSGPPVLPPHLLQVILNKETSVECEPTLLPEPNHVMLNHLYALSIKDGVMVLSATHRYKKKYVTTLLYKPTD